MTVLDASAILAFLGGEAGADRVEQALVEGVVCGAANWSEVAQKVRAREGSWTLAAALLASYDLVVEPVTAEDGVLAASLWEQGTPLSLGDRLCLALALRQSRPVLTADRAWDRVRTPPGLVIEQIR